MSLCCSRACAGVVASFSIALIEYFSVGSAIAADRKRWWAFWDWNCVCSRDFPGD